MILDRILQGENPLAVAQELEMAEREVTKALTEALEVKTEFYIKNAQSYQTLIIQRLEEAYRFARGFAYGGHEVEDADGNARIEPPSIHWFREMRGVLNDLQKLLAPHLEAKQQNTINLINPTILMGDPLAQRGAALSGWKDKDVTYLIEGQATHDDDDEDDS